MNQLDETKRILEEINSAILGYDPVLRERARDILLAQAFGILPPRDSANSQNGESARPPTSDGEPNGSLNTLIDRWPTRRQSDFALLGAYHLQHVLGYQVVTGRQIQNSLKHHGLRLTNVTVSTSENLNTTPARMERRNVPGNKQNCYRVTPDGVRYIKNKLNGLDRT